MEEKIRVTACRLIAIENLLIEKGVLVAGEVDRRAVVVRSELDQIMAAQREAFLQKNPAMRNGPDILGG